MTNKTYIPILAVIGAIMLVVVAAMAPPQSFFGRDLVHAQTIDDATLDMLSLTGVQNNMLSPDFSAAADTRTYSARVVDTATSKVTVTAESANNNATVTIRPSDQDSVENDHQVLLNAGRNTVITVTVRSEDRTVTETYTITVYKERTQPSDDADLSALRLSGVTLSPSFNSDKITYTGRAAYGTVETTVTTTADIGADSVAITPSDPANSDPGHQVVLAAGGLTAVQVLVTAEDGSAMKTYTVMVYRENLVKSDDTRLAASNGLMLTAPPENTAAVDGFTYVDGTKSYDVRMAKTVRAVTVEADPLHDGAVAVITPSDQDTETDDHQVLLRAGAKTNITVKVTAEDGTTTATYSITIYRERRVESGDDTLSALRLSGVTLSSAFASDKLSYIGRAPYSTDKTTVSYTADVGAMVTMTPPEVAPNDDIPGYQVVLTAGAVTPIMLSVEAENGDAATKTYTVMVYRENLVKSDEPRLAESTGLTLTAVGAGTTDFIYADGTKSYDVEAENGVHSVTVAADPRHDGAVAVITPSDQDSVTLLHQVVLGAGVKTNITIEVTAEDGTTTETYTVAIYRKRLIESGDDTLSSLRLSGVTLSSAFASDKLSYIGRAPYSTDETTVSYTADGGATVAMDPADPADSDPGYQVVLTAGAVTLIMLSVTAEDAGTPAKAYVVNVYRENLPSSDDASLSALTLMGTNETPDGSSVFTDRGTDDDAAFTYASATKSYPNVTVDNGVHVVTVDTTAHLGAVTVITPSDQDSLNDGHQVVLGAGAKTNITIEVTAEDGTTTETYSITIYRGRRVESEDANLSALDLSGVVLSPEFDGAKTGYTGTAAYNTQMTTVSYTADIGAQMVEISAGPDGPDAITEDANGTTDGYQVRLIRGQAREVRITVTPEVGAGIDSENNKVYTITVYRDNAPSSDATLQALTLSGLTLSPAFDPATTAYTAEVETLDMTTVEAMATHPGATVVGAGEKVLAVGDHEFEVTVTAEDGETSQNYTVTVTVLMGSTLLEIYDTNTNDQIDKNEAVAAIRDYIAGQITKADVVEVIRLYITG